MSILRDMDIHNYKKRYERTLERIKDSNEITDDNKEIVFNFKDYFIVRLFL